MGWKNVKEHYRIGHIVAVYQSKGICIGSPYCHDLIVIKDDGSVEYGRLGESRNDDLNRYYSEMTADKTKLVQLMQSPDKFERSLRVYTYEGGEILEKKCEKLGWPNVTHDGEIMYDNSFSSSKSKVVTWAKNNAVAGVEIYTERIQQTRDELIKLESKLEETRQQLSKLEMNYPSKVKAGKDS